MSRSNSTTIAARRAQRWDVPLSDEMTDELVDRVLRVTPFSQMDPSAFPRATPLRDIIKNDVRIVQFEQGEILLREGDYGASAYLVLEGNLIVSLDKLDPKITGRSPGHSTKGWRGLVAKLLGDGNFPSRESKSAQSGVFLQDIPGVLSSKRTAEIGPGEVFGELSALTRSPRTATVFAAQDSTLIEIRWQGLRDLMKYSPQLRSHFDTLYRKNSLRVHLRETPLLERLPENDLTKVVDAIEFESFGNFDWRDKTSGEDSHDLYQRALNEPIVIEEGRPVEGMLLIRNGFARVWKSHGEGRLTLSYLGKGSVLGAKELSLAVLCNESPIWKQSVSAVGYLDVLRLPRDAFNDHLLGHLSPDLVRGWASDDATEPSEAAPGADAARRFDFLVDRRLMNGPEAMVINLDRCTRCDDCLRACASTHDGVPRFTRQGPIHDGMQFTQACMHCLDPVCMIGCPTGAIHREESTGVVRINDGTCIGCSTCANSCPYSNIQMVELRDESDAIVFDPETGQPVLRASKCDLCFDRISEPACQDACSHDALVRIDLTTPIPLVDWSKR